MELELKSEEVRGGHEIGGRAPLSRGPPEAPPTLAPTPYIPSLGEKT